MSEWNVHHGKQVIVIAHDATAGVPLHFVAEAKVAEAQSLDDAVRTYHLSNNLIHFFIRC